MSDYFDDSVMDAASLAAHYEPEPVDHDDGVSQYDELLRIRQDKIEEELATETDPDVIDRLLSEARHNDRILEANSGVVWHDDDETMKERNARIRARDAVTRQDDRPAGTAYDPYPIEEEWSKERNRELKRLPVPGVLGADAAATRRFLREQLEAAGLDVDAHLRRPPRGRPTAESRAVRGALRPLFAVARDRGATLEALAAASNRTVSAVHELVDA